ncbi:TPA: protease, partial [Pseudomonas aeruginosa]|nr:protease [Pseudomonas aeruginosa]
NYLGQAKPIAALTQQQSAGRTSVPTSVDQLDEAALAVCSALQIKPEDYLKTLKGQ